MYSLYKNFLYLFGIHEVSSIYSFIAIKNNTTYLIKNYRYILCVHPLPLLKLPGLLYFSKWIPNTNLHSSVQQTSQRFFTFFHFKDLKKDVLFNSCFRNSVKLYPLIFHWLFFIKWLTLHHISSEISLLAFFDDRNVWGSWGMWG